MSALMDLIIDVENQLGWNPTQPLWRSRAAEHRKLSMAMARHGYSERDLRLALAWCTRRQQPIKAPLELIGYITRARELADEVHVPAALDSQISAAIDWENQHGDQATGAWITRLIRSFGPARADTLTDWHQGGRGE